jgi:hypothetical protein
MNDDLRFDPVDDALRRRFADGAPAGPDADTVLGDLRPRLRRARNQRRAVFSGALAAAAVVVVLLVLAFAGGGGTGSVRTPPASGGRNPDRGAAITTVPQPTVTTVDDNGSGGSGADDTAPSPTADTGAALPGAGPVPETVPTTTPAATPASYSSAGGSIVVNFDGSTVSLASSSPAAGFTAEVHDNGPSRVEVRFTNGATEWRIRVDVENGALSDDITQH